MRGVIVLIVILLEAVVQVLPEEQLAADVEKWARLLGEHLQQEFADATKEASILSMYQKLGEVEIFDPRIELKKAKNAIEAYLKRRAKAAWDAKISLESNRVLNESDDEVNDPKSMHFIRFMNAKSETDAVQAFSQRRTDNLNVTSTRTFNMTPNANFYGIPTSSIASAVHIPTPVYDRNSSVLQKIAWSDIDNQYRTNREETRDLAFQIFCSESGFMRYFPAASWIWDVREDQLDLFDCRNTEWYINGATLSKNVIIMLDLSGSMLGQRFEIAKQTVEAILETLSDNDFFNIIPFSRAPIVLDSCAEQAGLLQATLRNKKYLRSKLNVHSSEGKADYEKALTTAFQTLLRIHNSTSRRTEFACNDVIMLITDGAPAYYKEIFQLFNENKTVRFFSYLIGDEAIDFDEVKWMACTNKGFMVHISNLADVQEKVQHYIKVMSRPLGKHASSIGEKDAIWSGMYQERLYLPRPEAPSVDSAVQSNSSFSGAQGTAARRKQRIKRLGAKSGMFVSTVSYPVTVDGVLMGVAAVNVPVTELAQLANPFNLGGRSYTFLMNNNGYVMFHPQLRAFDPDTQQTKPNFNNVDILELEVPQNQQMMRRSMINCDNTDANKLDILFATEDLDRVYRQTNTYYAECIKDVLFTVGMAVAKDDEKRIRSKKTVEYSDVEMSWFEGMNWRMHPQWRYCLLNDSDYALTPEEAFTIYARQMKQTGKLPWLCEPRKELVDKFLFDMKVTNGLVSSWEVSWKSNRKRQIYLVFFSSTSGMLKVWKELPSGLTDNDPSLAETPSNSSKTTTTAAPRQYSFAQFDEFRRSSEVRYFRRSIRMKNRIVFDLNLKTKLWYTSETASAFGNNETTSLLLTATKALFMDNALVGVSGLEVTMDHFAHTLRKIGCGPQDDRMWCFLLDEHAYVVYSSLNSTRYSSVFSGDRDDKKSSVLGKWFGGLNRITESTMRLLLNNNFYTEVTYVDYQATCKHQMEKITTAAAFRPVLSIVKPIVSMLTWIISRIWNFAREFAILRTLEMMISPTVAYTVTFHDGSDGVQCDKASNFYLANWGEEGWSGPQLPLTSALIAGNLAERPCSHNKAKCAVKMYANWVPHTNLLLVVISQGSSKCYDETECPLSSPPEVPFRFTQVDNASDKLVMSMDPSDPTSTETYERRCRHVVAKQRKPPVKCIHSDDDESTLACSHSGRSFSASAVAALCMSVLGAQFL